MAELYATCPNCGDQHMHHDQSGYNQWFCWQCDRTHENNEIKWVAERSDSEDYSLTYKVEGERTMSKYGEAVKRVVDGIDKLAATLQQGAKDALEIVAEMERLKALREEKEGAGDGPGEEEKVE